MGVQTEINRLSSAKTAIASAIAAKGVTVPSTTKLDGMAPLIESIPAGGAEWPDAPTAGNMPVLMSANLMGFAKYNMSALNPAVSITIPKSGTYRIKYSYVVGAFPQSLSGIPVGSIRLRKNGSTVTTHSSSSSNYTPSAKTASRDMALNAGDVIELYGSAPYSIDSSTGGYSYSVAAGGSLTACIAPIDGYEDFIS